jgi:putative peptidoglycan lipid II flippase
VLLAGILFLAAKFAASRFGSIAFHDEITLVLLIAVGAIVYAGLILGLFGPRWLKGLVQG